MIKVHLKGEHSTEELDRLRELTGDRFSITSGKIDSVLDCEVLAGGRVTENELSLCRGLRAVVIPWAGVPSITLEAVRNFPGVTLHNIHHNAVAAAEMAITLMLAASKLIIPADQALRIGDWTARYRSQGRIIENSRVLVLGWGSIGKRVGKICSAMGASVKGIRRTPAPGLFTPEDMLNILAETDILHVTLPLTEETRGIIGERELALLPAGSVLVNVARGPVVDEKALYHYLKKGHLGGAGLDVWYNYPDSEDSRSCTMPSSFDFGSLPNVVMSPHRGGAFGLEELERKRLKHLAAMILALADGDSEKGKINLETGY